MEASATVLVVIALIGAGFALVSFVVQELMRASGAGAARNRLEAVLEALEALAYGTAPPAGSVSIGGADAWGDRGPLSIDDARSVLLQVLAETPVEYLASDAALWRRVQRMLAISRPGAGRPAAAPSPPAGVHPGMTDGRR